MTGFLSRPTLPQLALDLIEVQGGGLAPSQYEGRTGDGRPVFIRYRGGWLSVRCGNPNAAWADHASPLLLNARIGQSLHGEILFDQISDLTGITLRGERLQLSEAEFLTYQARGGRLQDFSGRRIYWERSALVSAAGGDDFIRAFCRRFSGTRLLSWSFASTDRPHLRDRTDGGDLPDDWCFYFVGGPKARSVLDIERLGDGAIGLTVIVANAEWKDATARRARGPRPDHPGERRGPWIEDAHRRHPPHVWRLSCRGCFLAADAAAAAYFAEVEAFFAAAFAESGEIFDPATTRAIRKDKAPLPYSRDLIAWCAEDPSNSICAVDRDGSDEPPFWSFRATAV